MDILYGLLVIIPLFALFSTILRKDLLSLSLSSLIVYFSIAVIFFVISTGSVVLDRYVFGVSLVLATLIEVAVVLVLFKRAG